MSMTDDTSLLAVMKLFTLKNPNLDVQELVDEAFRVTMDGLSTDVIRDSILNTLSLIIYIIMISRSGDEDVDGLIDQLRSRLQDNQEIQVLNDGEHPSTSNVDLNTTIPEQMELEPPPGFPEEEENNEEASANEDKEYVINIFKRMRDEETNGVNIL